MNTRELLDEIHEAQEILEEMQRDRDEDEKRDIFGRLKGLNYEDDRPQEV